MLDNNNLPNMGVVVCANCNSEIENFHAWKVTTLYSICSDHCMNRDNERDENRESV